MSSGDRFIQPQQIWKHRERALGPLVVDTETSGLYVDDGARCSVVSAAWMVDERDAALWRDLGCATVEPEAVADGLPRVWIASVAWPFDQGVDGKPELGARTGAVARGIPGPGKGRATQGQEVIWPDAPNQEWWVWRGLIKLLRVWPSGLVFHNAKFDQHILRAGVRRERWGWLEKGQGQGRPGVDADFEGWAGDGADVSEQTIWDTQLVAKRLWPLAADPKTGLPTSSLKPTASRLWGVAETDEAEKVKKYLAEAKLPTGRWDLVPWSIIGPYADQDARLTLRLILRQQYDIAQLGRGRGAEVGERIARDRATMQMLYRQEVRGVPYPRDESDAWARELERRGAEVAQGLPFSPVTLPAAKRYYFGDPDWTEEQAHGAVVSGDSLGLKPYSVTDTGAPQMTAQVVLQMQRDGVKDIELWADYQKLQTAASMWYRGYSVATNAEDGRLRTCYRQVARGKEGDGGTRSTRFSVERVNLQAIPQNYRLDGFACLDGVPSPRDLIAAAVPAGWQIWELDLAQAELRVGALFGKCKPMLEMMRAGADLHTYTTHELFPKVDERSEEWTMWRGVGKRANFSLGFGAGGETFGNMIAKETGIYLGDREAERVVRHWNRLYPEWGKAIQAHSRRVELRQKRMGYGWVQLVNGENRWFTEYEDTHKAFNQRVQGSLAQFGIEWALQTESHLGGRWRMDELASQAGLSAGAGLILLIHDSQVLMLPEQRAGEIAAECAGFANRLWDEWFAGVPGGSEAKQWKGHKVMEA